MCSVGQWRVNHRTKVIYLTLVLHELLGVSSRNLVYCDEVPHHDPAGTGTDSAADVAAPGEGDPGVKLEHAPLERSFE